MREFLTTGMIIFMMLLISCSNPESSNENKQLESKTISIKNNELQEELLENISIGNIDKNFNRHVYSLDKQELKNQFDSIQIDTIFNYYNNLDSVWIYKCIDKEFLLGLSIKSQTFIIGKNIKNGMTCDEIIKKLKIKEANYDTISIETDDETVSENVLKLIFHDKYLKQITFYSFPD
jgi:hypothetical protein